MRCEMMALRALGGGNEAQGHQKMRNNIRIGGEVVAVAADWWKGDN
jgi:hypothetical protein